MGLAGVTAVEARISSIQQRFGSVAPALAPGMLRPALPGAGAAGTGGATSGAAFRTEVDRASASLATAPRGGATSAAGPSSGEDVVAVAKEYLGVPYVLGGNGPDEGLDCSGLTELVYRRFGIDLPPVSWQQIKTGRPVAGLSEARPGDLVFFGRPTSHVGIYAGDGMMVHAPRPGKSVEVVKVYETPTAIRRVLPDGPVAAPAQGAAAAPAAAPATSPPLIRPASGPAVPAASAAAAPPARLVPALAAHAGALGPVPYAEHFRAAEQEHGVPARVLAALAQVESGFRPDATSSAGARGIMQFMPGTARWLGVDPLDPASAIDGAARLLKRHVGEFGSLPLALAAYNAGEGAVRRAGGIPPYAETRNHVSKVMSLLGVPA